MTIDPKVTAWRLIALALDDHSHAKPDYIRLLMSQIERDGSMRDVLIALADIAATLQEKQTGVFAYCSALDEIEGLITGKTPKRTPPCAHTPRPHRDRPTNRKSR